MTWDNNADRLRPHERAQLEGEQLAYRLGLYWPQLSPSDRSALIEIATLTRLLKRDKEIQDGRTA